MEIIKKAFLSFALATTALTTYGQSDSTNFRANLYNKEYDISMILDLHERELNVPGHELYGPLAGYLGISTSTFYWLVVDAEIKGKEATLQMVNDYGSEDLTATLTQLTDSTYRLTQGKGSIIRVPHNKKWMKLPKILNFKKR
jgi:hypothetical protein